MELRELAQAALNRGETVGKYHHRAVIEAIDAARPAAPVARNVTGRTDLCPDCGHRIHRGKHPKVCDWYDCGCPAAPVALDVQETTYVVGEYRGKLVPVRYKVKPAALFRSARPAAPVALDASRLRQAFNDVLEVLEFAGVGMPCRLPLDTWEGIARRYAALSPKEPTDD